jgi:hypothetical protein
VEVEETWNPLQANRSKNRKVPLLHPMEIELGQVKKREEKALFRGPRKKDHIKNITRCNNP